MRNTSAVEAFGCSVSTVYLHSTTVQNVIRYRSCLSDHWSLLSLFAIMMTAHRVIKTLKYHAVTVWSFKEGKVRVLWQTDSRLGEGTSTASDCTVDSVISPTLGCAVCLDAILQTPLQEGNYFRFPAAQHVQLDKITQCPTCSFVPSTRGVIVALGLSTWRLWAACCETLPSWLAPARWLQQASVIVCPA